MAVRRWLHQSLSLASLRLKGKFADDEIEAAAMELMDKGFIVPCSKEYHSDCWRIEKAEAQ